MKTLRLVSLGSAFLLAVPAQAAAPFQCDTVRRLEERGGIPCFLQLANRVESENFSVEWGPAGTVSQAAADGLLAELESSRARFMDAGYAQPAGNPAGNRVPYYLGDSGGGAPGINFSGGYTTVCNDFSHAYVVMSSIEDAVGTLDVANHELFHAVQMGSPSPYGVEGFYWEASATWAEEFVQPDYDIYQWFLPSYTNNTTWALDHEDGSQDGFLHKYALFILPMFMGESAPGGHDVLLGVWNGDANGVIPRMNEVWADGGHETDFAEQFGAFTAHVSTMDFVDGLNYDFARVPARDVLTGDTELTDVIAPRWFGSHFYRVLPTDDDVLEGRTKMRVSFDGGQLGWVVAINRSPDDREAIPTVLQSDGEGLASTAVIDVGSEYARTWIVVSSTQTENQDYSLSITFEDQTEAPGSDLEPPEEEGPRRGGGASCAGVTSHPFGYRGAASLSLLLLLLPMVRRRP
ncbi:MAG: hypothetical protein GY898_02110 [Proteobacteria bacterium]|nr:hypothetical protein [Pseudomonadota bacterium]